MGWFSKNSKLVENNTVENIDIECFRSINTEGLDLSQPFVDDYFSRGFSWVFFGEENLYPQILNQLYISAPMHQACCNFKKYSLIGNGYEWQGYESLSVAEKIQIKQFETMSGLFRNKSKLVLDWIKHGRVIVLVHYSQENKKYTHFKLVDPQDIRNSYVGIFKDNPDKYFYSKDWTRSASQMEFKPMSPNNTDEWQVVEIRNNVGGFKAYGMPDWVSSANWQKVGADISLLHKSAIENGIQPSVIFKYPYVMSPDERMQWEQGMQKNAKGAKNYGRAYKVESQSKDLMPETEVVSTTDNHALFEQTSKEYKEEVAISHNINPALMGVRVAGSLGATDEIEFSAEQFKKLWINENKEIIEKFLNELAQICGIRSTLVIKETDILTAKEIIESGISEISNVSGEPVSLDKEADARAQLKGSVGGVQGIIQIQTAVAQGIADRGSAIALLELIYGFKKEEAISLLGDAEQIVPTETSEIPKVTALGNSAEKMEDIGNSALRGLTAKENMDMVRIVREFNKGKLSEPLARIRLSAYGIENNIIDEILAL